MRVHFAYISIVSKDYTHEMITREGESGINVTDGNNQSLYTKYTKSRVGDDTFDKSDIWTKWGYGDTLKIQSYATRKSSVKYLIDKYQVVIGNETITLDANEQKFCSAIWNATVPPGSYTVWADVEDQSRSAAMFVNGTDLAVTDLSVPDEVWDGDNVSIDVTML